MNLLSFGTVSATLARSANNYNLIRAVAALCVIASHAFSIRLGEVDEPLRHWTPYDLGDHSVNVFFALSGLLVAMSFERSRTLEAYAAARVLRIVPGLLVCSLLLAFVMGPLVTDLPWRAYFADPQTWLYPLRAALLFDDEAGLPGVFADLPQADFVNEPIWTLGFEMAAYLGIALLGLAGMLRSDLRTLAVLGLAVALFLWITFDLDPDEPPDMIEHASRFFVIFMLGAAAYRFRDRLVLSPLILVAIAAVVWLAADTGFEKLTWLVAAAYATLLVGALPLGPLRALSNRIDLSYGIYIYGWPISQLIMHAAPTLAPMTIASLTWALAIPAAVASWFLVEKPSLDRKAALGAWLERLFRGRRVMEKT